MTADRIREIFDREIAGLVHDYESTGMVDWLTRIRDEVIADASLVLCGFDGGHSDIPNHDHACARPMNHPLTDIPVEGAAIESSHRCSCGEVWCDAKDIIYG